MKVEEEIMKGPKPYPANVIEVEPLDNYKLKVKLSNGLKGIFDVSPYLNSDFFKELKDPAYFHRVFVKHGTVVWPHEQDFSPETIEARMAKIEPEKRRRSRVGAK